jgi:hypothetical protein
MLKIERNQVELWRNIHSLHQVVRGLFVTFVLTQAAGNVFSAQSQHEVTGSPTAGRYVLAKNEEIGYSMCKPFTQNLNEFRQFDFDYCASKLSEKYSRFSRPEWHEIPFDLAMAEKIIKGAPKKSQSERREAFWRKWLVRTESMRQAGEMKMWNADIDFDGTRTQVTRMTNAFSSQLFGGTENCQYRDTSLYVDEGTKSFGKNFNSKGAIADLIHDSDSGKYFLVSSSNNPTTGSGIWGKGHPIFVPKATRGIAVYEVKPTLGPIAICNIQWVPDAATSSNKIRNP